VNWTSDYTMSSAAAASGLSQNKIYSEASVRSWGGAQPESTALCRISGKSISIHTILSFEKISGKLTIIKSSPFRENDESVQKEFLYELINDPSRSRFRC
jgi:hypothetical protein